MANLHQRETQHQPPPPPALSFWDQLSPERKLDVIGIGLGFHWHYHDFGLALRQSL